MRRRVLLALPASLALAGLLSHAATARPPIRSAFFDTYPIAVDTQLDALPSDSRHCGVCHFDFSGAGARTPYGLGIEIGIQGGLTDEQAILAIETSDSDADGFSNLVEITDVANFSNTPTFPGLTAGNVGQISGIPPGEVLPYLTPSGGSDVTPPVVAVTWPNGGENVFAVGFVSVTYTATDASGISHVDLFLSDDGGVTWKPVGKNEPPTGTFDWFVANLPGAQSRIRVVAVDGAGNPGMDASDGDFTIVGLAAGLAPTTLRDMELPGTQPFEGAILEDPSACATCHGNYDAANEPWANWGGSPMAQAARDPLFLACMAVAEQDAPSVGDLCLRCHTPGGWQEGRSVDTSGGLLTAKDRAGVQCDFCHRQVDWDYMPGLSPPEDEAVLGTVSPLPLQYGNGQFVNDPAPVRRGPFADAEASHQFLESPFHRSSDLCGTCHDVSNPVFVRVGPEDYALDPLDQEHADFDQLNMFPVERTFSEWSRSEYAVSGVYAPQFAGNKPDGIVSSCQDCHMRDVDAKGANVSGVPRRPDLPLHDFMGGNTFLADVLPAMWPGEVDALQMLDARARAVDMLELAATLQGTPEAFGLTVRVINETGHKLPSGYPEGRRIWLHVRAVDAAGATVFESGAYDATEAELEEDPQLKVYEIHPGLSPGLAAALGLSPGKSFHFVLNDSIYFDNRIPPRGFTNAAFAEIQSPPVAYPYADGQYWDDTPYQLPAAAETAHVALLYQITTKEYVEFLRDENVTNSAGDDLHAAWVASGKAPPVTMASIVVPLDPIVTDAAGAIGRPNGVHVGPARPSPFVTRTAFEIVIPEPAPVRVMVYDVTGRRVATLHDGFAEAGRHEMVWDGRGVGGSPASSGVYFVESLVGSRAFRQRVVRLR